MTTKMKDEQKTVNSTSKSRILIIDDEELLTKSFGLLLRRSGYDVSVAKNGTEALALVGVEKFDLVICDIRMPGLNGVETIRAIRKTGVGHLNADVPVIFISGFADEKTETKASELKPLGHLYKPFDNFELLKMVRSRLA